MADETTTQTEPEQPAAEAEPGDGSIAVEVEPERRKSQVNDEELAKLTSVSDDEIARANAEAKKAVKSLRTAYQEQRRRAEQWSADAATASNLAEQLYRENQELRQNVTRSETALVEQAIVRAEAQLENAKAKARQAQASGDPDLIVAAQTDMAEAVSEVGRLKLLRPVPGTRADAAPSATLEAAPAAPPQQAPPRLTERTRSWIAAHPWFGFDQPYHDKEMSEFAMRQHRHLEVDGITEASNPDLYWRTIETRLAEQFPEKFQSQARPTEGRARPVAVTGGTRSNGAASTTNGDGKRVVRLTESQVRISRKLGLTPEQYAAQLVREEQQADRNRRPQ